MHGETHVLKQRVEVIAVERRRKHPLERVRRQQQEGQEADTDPRLHRQGARLGLGGDVRSEPGDARAEHREDQDPEQQRTLMAAPGPGHLVEHRLERMGILDDVPDGEVADDEGLHQRCEGHGHKQHLSYCRRLGGFHPDSVSTRRARNRQDTLNKCKRQREGQCKVTDFRKHGDLSYLRLVAWRDVQTRNVDYSSSVAFSRRNSSSSISLFAKRRLSVSCALDSGGGVPLSRSLSTRNTINAITAPQKASIMKPPIKP